MHSREDCDILLVLKGILHFRVWRSLVSRLNGVQEAAGSNPVTRTISSVHNATEHSYVKEQSKGRSFAISVGLSAPVERPHGRSFSFNRLCPPDTQWLGAALEAVPDSGAIFTRYLCANHRATCSAGPAQKAELECAAGEGFMGHAVVFLNHDPIQRLILEPCVDKKDTRQKWQNKMLENGK